MRKSIRHPGRLVLITLLLVLQGCHFGDLIPTWTTGTSETVGHTTAWTPTPAPSESRDVPNTHVTTPTEPSRVTEPSTTEPGKMAISMVVGHDDPDARTDDPDPSSDPDAGTDELTEPTSKRTKGRPELVVVTKETGPADPAEPSTGATVPPVPDTGGSDIPLPGREGPPGPEGLATVRGADIPRKPEDHMIWELPLAPGEAGLGSVHGELRDVVVEDYAPHWRRESDPDTLAAMLAVEAALDARQYEPLPDYVGEIQPYTVRVDILPMFSEGLAIRDDEEDQFFQYLSTIAFSVLDGSYKYFDYVNEYWYNYYYEDCTFDDGTTGKAMTEINLHFIIQDEYADPEHYARRLRELEAEARELAVSIMDRTSSDVGRLMLLHDYLVRSKAYSPDYDDHTNNVVYGLLGDVTMCQGYSHAFQLVGNRMGYRIDTVYGYAYDAGPGGEDMAHLWNLVELGDTHYHVDVTFDDPVENTIPYPYSSAVHFLRSDAAMHERVIYTRDLPPAPADYIAHLEAAGLVYDSYDALVEAMSDFMRESVRHRENLPSHFTHYLLNADLTTETHDGMINEAFGNIATIPQVYYWHMILGGLGDVVLDAHG